MSEPQAKNTMARPSAASGVEKRRELADFLKKRRLRTQPADVGIPLGPGRRRTPGLRREEVAELAGIGVTWYTWLEQARDVQPSIEALQRIAQALKLDSVETRHLLFLAGKILEGLSSDQPKEAVPESLLRLLHRSLQDPAVILGQTWDVLAWNEKATHLFIDFGELPAEERNWIHFVFTSTLNRSRVINWERNAERLCAEFRASVGPLIEAPRVSEFVERMKRISPDFKKMWEVHDIRGLKTASFRMRHPEYGDVTFERHVLRPLDSERMYLMIFTQAS